MFSISSQRADWLCGRHIWINLIPFLFIYFLQYYEVVCSSKGSIILALTRADPLISFIDLLALAVLLAVQAGGNRNCRLRRAEGCQNWEKFEWGKEALFKIIIIIHALHLWNKTLHAAISLAWKVSSLLFPWQSCRHRQQLKLDDALFCMEKARQEYLMGT